MDRLLSASAGAEVDRQEVERSAALEGLDLDLIEPATARRIAEQLYHVVRALRQELQPSDEWNASFIEALEELESLLETMLESDQ